MTPTQAERREAAREEILQAARRAFVERGFRATTMRDISRLSGRSIGSIYHHFGSKEGIISELLTSEAFFRQWQGLLGMFIGEDVPDDLEEIAWAIKSEVEKNAEFIRLILWDAVEFRGEHFQKFMDQQESLINVFIEVIGDKLQHKGFFRTVDPRVAIYVFANTFFDLFGRRALFGVEIIEGMDDAELIRQVSRLFAKGVLAGE
ncbi:MAG: TetR/AcrR family transcriptional regulator [Actinobacteria bacterium]|jgi:AcrR family transcriptional regulator|nr:MAG: TetR/AcrR family transcriptional regulator [Actinomycetota bacterium]